MVVQPCTPEPSVAVAQTVTVPGDPPVNIPVEEFMVAEPVPLVTDQVTLGFVALAGVTVATICRVLPERTEVAPPWPWTLIELTIIGLMVITVQPCTAEPSVAVAQMVTVPGFPAVNIPVLALIVPVPVPGVKVQVTVWLEALAGVTVATICKVLPERTVVAPPWP